mgnify:CR=1 FL=1
MHAHQDVKRNTPHGFQVKFSKALNQDALIKHVLQSQWRHNKKLTPILFISEFCRALATIFGPSVMCFYLLVTSVTPSQFSLPLVKLVSWNVVQVVHWDLVWVKIECLCLPSGDLVWLRWYLAMGWKSYVYLLFKLHRQTSQFRPPTCEVESCSSVVTSGRVTQV